MSGIEVAGLVLGGFPILMKCLGQYREGFELLEEWWNFRTHFIAFMDDLNHQMMRYQESMIRLLDPIVADTARLDRLIQDPRDPGWSNGTLDDPLRKHLGSEYDRFFRTIERMRELITDVERLLQIEDGEVCWLGTAEQKPWQWQLKRIRISFSKGKHRKVRKLAAYNQEIQEILGYSERLTIITDRRTCSEPTARLEKIRQHSGALWNILQRQWICNRQCHSHGAHLSIRAETVSVRLNVLFSQHERATRRTLREVEVLPPETTQPKPIRIGHISSSTKFANVQEMVRPEIPPTDPMQKPHFLRRLFQKPLTSRSSNFKRRPLTADPGHKGGSAVSLTSVKKVTFDTPVPTLVIPPSSGVTANTTSSSGPAPSIPDQMIELCAFLAHHGKEPVFIREGETDRCFEFSKPSRSLSTGTALDRLQLFPLSDVIGFHHRGSLDIPRQTRFEMASHIASGLLQIYQSPWFPLQWSKHHLYFLVDTESHTLHASYPFVSYDFLGTQQPAPGGICQRQETGSREGNARHLTLPPLSSSCHHGHSSRSPHAPFHDEEETRAQLFTLGVMILELIFGHAIEDCHFRKDYYGHGDKPNDQTDISTARRWAKKVLGESGANIADVVRRCLDCSFDPRPSLENVRFRESIWEKVVSPLRGYGGVWDIAMA